MKDAVLGLSLKLLDKLIGKVMALDERWPWLPPATLLFLIAANLCATWVGGGINKGLASLWVVPNGVVALALSGELYWMGKTRAEIREMERRIADQDEWSCPICPVAFSGPSIGVAAAKAMHIQHHQGDGYWPSMRN